MTPATAPPRLRVWLALWTVYLIWGSTYLAIRVAVHPSHGAGMPPMLMAGVRFLLAGALMLVFTIRRPAADGRPDPLGLKQWGSAAVVGGALVFGGNGFVSVAEQRIPSGIAALVVAMVPILTALLGAAFRTERLAARHGVGLVLGFAGVGALVVGQGKGRVDPAGLALVVLAATSWASGSYWSRTAPLPRRPLVTTGMEMLCGGAMLLVVGSAAGEAGRLDLARVPMQSWLALAYLLVAGSMLAYTAYVWLLHNATLSLATTYAYVNPLVAVFLGTLLLGEPFTGRAAIATLAIVAGVVLIVSRRAAPTPAPAPAAEPAAAAVHRADPAEVAP